MPPNDSQSSRAEVSGAAIRVERLGAGLHDRWDRYVRGHSEGSVYHLAGWQRAVEAATNSEDRSIVALDGGAIVGGVPLGLVRSRFFGTSLISAPFATGGGILAEFAEVHAALRGECESLMRETGASHVALRYQHDADGDLAGSDLYCGFRRALPENPDECLAMLPRKARAAARKGLGCGSPPVPPTSAPPFLPGAFRARVESPSVEFGRLWYRTTHRNLPVVVADNGGSGGPRSLHDKCGGCRSQGVLEGL